MSKTAMQELINWLEQNEIYYNKDLILKIKECLEKEKEQIRSAYNDGRFAVLEHDEKTSDIYYNQTYNQNK